MGGAVTALDAVPKTLIGIESLAHRSVNSVGRMSMNRIVFELREWRD